MSQSRKKVPHLCSLCSCLRSSIDRNPPSDRIMSFQSSLLSDLQTLRPKTDDSQVLLSLQSIGFALNLALRIQQEAMNLLKEEEEEGEEDDGSYEEKQVMKEYLDDSVDLLKVCNGLTAKISELQRHHLLIKHALCLLKGTKIELERTRVSLKEWLDSIWIHRQIESESYGPPFKTLCGRLLSQNVEVEKLCDFSYVCYSAKAVAVFACVLLALAITRADRFPEISLPSNPHFPWFLSATEIFQVAKEKAGIRFDQGYCLPLLDLGKVEDSVKQMLPIIDAVLEHGQEFYLTEEESEIVSLAMELKQASDSLSEGLNSVGKNVTELFHAVITNRSSLLDQIMISENPW